MSGKVGDHFYCIFCDVKFNSEADFKSHCNGKKHKNNERIKSEQDAANASVLVRGAKGCKNLEQFLASYFCQFGLLTKISALGPTSHGIARVQFAQPEFAARVLNAGSVHRHCGLSLRVCKFEYKPHGGDAMRVAAREEMQKQKSSREELHTNIMQILGKENLVESQLLAVTEILQLTTKDLLDRQEIARKLKEVFAPKHPDATVFQFGSSINRFGVRGCDLDLFLNINLEKPVSNKQMKNLHKIMSSRHLMHTFTDTLVVPSHRCPIIKFTHKQTGIKCDLSLNNKKALFNTLLLRLYATDERVRHVVYALRLWAKFRGLSGGVGASAPTLLSSYALTLLALFYLMRCRPEPVLPAVCDLEKCVPGISTKTVEESQCLIIPEDAELPKSKNTQTSGELLHGLFKFYRDEINWSQDAILMKDATITPRATLTQNFNYLKCRVGAMTVIDPFSLSHNVAGNVNETFREHLVEEMKRAAELTSCWADSDTSSPVSGGLQDLFELLELDVQKQPNQNDKGNTKNGTENSPNKGKKSKPKKNNPVRMEGEQENGDFHIILPLSQATLESDWLKVEAQSADLLPEQYWLNKAKDLTLNVLENIFLAELEDKEHVAEVNKESCEPSTKSEPEKIFNKSGHELHIRMDQDKDKQETGVALLDPSKGLAEDKERSAIECCEVLDVEMEIEEREQEMGGHGIKRSSEKFPTGTGELERPSLNQSKITENIRPNVELDDKMPKKRLCIDGTQDQSKMKEKLCTNVELDGEMPKKRLCIDGTQDQSKMKEKLCTNVELDCEMPKKRLCSEGTQESLSRLRNVNLTMTTAAVTTVSSSSSCITTTTTTTITASSSSVSKALASTVLCAGSSMDAKTSLGNHETGISQHTGGTTQVTSEQSLFWCRCRHPVWHGRKKLKQEVMQHADSTVPSQSQLDLEVEITNRYLKQIATSASSGISPAKPPSLKQNIGKSSEECSGKTEHTKSVVKETGLSTIDSHAGVQNNKSSADVQQPQQIPSITPDLQNTSKHSDKAHATTCTNNIVGQTASKETAENANVEKSTPSTSHVFSPEDIEVHKCSPNIETESQNAGEFVDNKVVNAGARLERFSLEKAKMVAQVNCRNSEKDAEQIKLTEASVQAKGDADTAKPISSIANPTSGASNVIFGASNSTANASKPTSSVPNPIFKPTSSVLNPTTSASKPTCSVLNPSSSATGTNCSSTHSTLKASQLTTQSKTQQATLDQIEGEKKPIASEEDPFCLRFSCELVLNVGGTKLADSTAIPPPPTHLLIKLRPSKDPRHFKVFYDSFRSIMIRLNSTELNIPS